MAGIVSKNQPNPMHYQLPPIDFTVHLPCIWVSVLDQQSPHALVRLTPVPYTRKRPVMVLCLPLRPQSEHARSTIRLSLSTSTMDSRLWSLSCLSAMSVISLGAVSVLRRKSKTGAKTTLKNPRVWRCCLLYPCSWKRCYRKSSMAYKENRRDPQKSIDAILFFPNLSFPPFLRIIDSLDCWAIILNSSLRKRAKNICQSVTYHHGEMHSKRNHST